MASSELSCYLLVLPAQVTPLSLRIFELLHYGVRYKEAGLNLMLALVGTITSGLAWSVLLRNEHTDRRR
jgi:hypothetical protein